MGDEPEIYHGTDGDGNEVSYAEDGRGGFYLSDGHKDSSSFWGSHDDKGHDHFDNKGGGTSRGKYTG
jgi:hypothetical protein